MENNDGKLLPVHHVQQELCVTRPLYRQGKKLTAVKVYTINNESQHLIFYRVPKINLSNELRALCSKYGELKKLRVLTKYKTEDFTECYHAHYERIQSARIAKRFLDNKSFYGEILHVCYAPEFETISETREKLKQREKDVLSRLEPGPTLLEYANVQPNDNSSQQQNRKRKYPALPITEKRLQNEDIDAVWKGIPSELDPRNQSSGDLKLGIKKHFHKPVEIPKGVEYGPYIPSVIPAAETTEVKQTTPRVLLPTAVMKNIKQMHTNKRIVFRNKEKNNE